MSMKPRANMDQAPTTPCDTTVIILDLSALQPQARTEEMVARAVRVGVNMSSTLKLSMCLMHSRPWLIVIHQSYTRAASVVASTRRDQGYEKYTITPLSDVKRPSQRSPWGKANRAVVSTLCCQPMKFDMVRGSPRECSTQAKFLCAMRLP